MNEFLAPFEAMLDALFPPGRVRAIESGADWSSEFAEVEKSGFLDALVAGSEGGAGLGPGEATALWTALGSRAAPLEIGEAMIDRAGLEQPFARALLVAAALSGAADRALAMTVDHAQTRVQFGKPIGRRQAVQQQIAVMAEEVVAVRFAVSLAAAGDEWPSPERTAIAWATASRYAPSIANTAHAVHGAIGISAEFDLQLYTRRLHAWRLDGGGETLWSRRLGRAVLAADESVLDWMRSRLFQEKVVDALGLEPRTR